MVKKGKKQTIKQVRDKSDSVSQSQVAPSSFESPTNEALVSSNSVINGGSEDNIWYFPKVYMLIYQFYA